MFLYGWLLFFAFVSGVGSNTAGNVYTRRRNLVKLIEEAKKSVNSKVSDETVTKLAEVLAWFDEPKFSEEVIEIVFTNPLINEKLNDTQIQAVLLDFKMDGMRHSAIDAFYSKLPRTHQSSSIVEKSHVGEEINFAFKEQLRRGFTLIYTLNKIWSENYQCWQTFNQPLKKWKEVGKKLGAL